MEVSRLCSTLVQIRSENPPGNTREIIEYISDYLEGLGIKGTVINRPEGRCNLIAGGNQDKLLLCGHVDVVPALNDGWTHEPFSGDIAGGFVWGRGSTDMKGGCAAILTAVKRLADRGEEHNAALAFVCDEETGGESGMRYLLSKNLLNPCDCLIAEPTPYLNPCTGQKGLCRLRINFKGKPTHGSLYPHFGVSAIMEAYNIIFYLKMLNERNFAVNKEIEEIIVRSSGVLSKVFGMSGISGIEDVIRKITFNPGRITGGEGVNVVAQNCLLDVEMRIPWGCNVNRLTEEITGRAGPADVEIRTASAPAFTSSHSDIVQITCDEIEKVYGKPVQPIVHWAASDARHLRKAGFDVVEYGPGEILTLHGIDERVSVSQLESATAIYEKIIQRYT